jgi:NTP pyrophosphatase (non-canonical NTP hydrolase)
MLLLLFINYKNMQELLQQYKEIEKYAHVSFDDIMNKVSQEIAELVEAKVLQNDEEIHKEASDVLINLLSLSHDLGILEEEYAPLSTEILSLVIQHGKWNSDVNAYRQKYSKTQKSLDEVKASTKNLINSVL